MYHAPCRVSRTDVREPLELVIHTSTTPFSITGAGHPTITVGSRRMTTGGRTTTTSR
jgi:hypothetical protein